MSTELKDELLALPEIELGTRFGGEAFFYRRKFFCHLHVGSNMVFIETFVGTR